MILSSPSVTLVPGGTWLLAAVACGLYITSALPLLWLRRMSAAALLGGFVLHGLLLLIDIGGFGQSAPGARLGFGPVLSMTVWLVVAVYTVESRLVPLPAVRMGLGAAGALAVLVAAMFPGELRVPASALAPLHFALGVGSYGLFGAAVLHAVMLDSAERHLRRGGVGAAAFATPAGATAGTNSGHPADPADPAGRTLGLPLLQLERLTFRFVEVGFAVLTATLVLGLIDTVQWRWGNHKAVFSLLAWGVFAALLVGRHLRGWRGRRATRWVYAGAVLLLLGYAGSRFVLEVLLGRTAG